MSNPEELMKTIAGQLLMDGWNRDQLGNTLTHPDYPKAKIVLTYSGGQIQLNGRNGDHKISRNVTNIYNALTNTGLVRDFIKDNNVPLP